MVASHDDGSILTRTPVNPEKKYWLDNPHNVQKIVYALYAICALLVLADFFYHKHTHFPMEGWGGFFGSFGLAACVALVLAAKLMRIVLKREEDYYDE